MENSDKPDDVSIPRKTLKLKSPAARAASAPKGAELVATPTARERAPGITSDVPTSGPPRRSPRGAPRAQEATSWADEHKRRMQADMDALGGGEAGRNPAPPPRPRR